jgi:hypothetical protein
VCGGTSPDQARTRLPGTDTDGLRASRDVIFDAANDPARHISVCNQAYRAADQDVPGGSSSSLKSAVQEIGTGAKVAGHQGASYTKLGAVRRWRYLALGQRGPPPPSLRVKDEAVLGISSDAIAGAGIAWSSVDLYRP